MKEFIKKNILFFFFLSFLIGVSTGCLISYKIYRMKMDESINVGGFLYEKKIYDIKERISTTP